MRKLIIKLPMICFALALFTIGVLVIDFTPRTVLGLFFLFWANNISQRMI